MVAIQNSPEGYDESYAMVVVTKTLKIGNHNYKSNWVVADSRCDVLLGIPRHVANNPKVDSDMRIV